MAKLKLPKFENGKADAPPVYFLSLTMKDVKCFQGENTIDLSDGKGGWAKWTVILGNNNTGKTTILKCLAGMETVQSTKPDSQDEYVFAPLGFPENEIEEGKNYSVSAVIGENGQKKSHWMFASGLSDQTPENDLIIFVRSVLAQSNGLIIDAFGVTRSMTTIGSSERNQFKRLGFFENENLPNCEDWLISLFTANKLGQKKALFHLELAAKILTEGLLPDVTDFRIISSEKGSGFENYVQFKTDFGWVRLREMGFGYQAMMAWVLDLVRRMIERYGGEDPLAQPAIVLVDEIDLHLHPDWQRKIIAHLDKYFPKTQFIVTAHSPLIVQSAENVNLVVLKKEADHVSIEQPKLRNYRGWTVEEILTDIMQLEGKTMSQTYLDLMNRFDEALDNDDFEAAHEAFDELSKILHPQSPQRKLLKLQMTSLQPA